MRPTIPRRIIQIWGGWSEPPLSCRAAAANVQLLNPDFEYLLFDDKGMDDFIKAHFPEYRTIFQSLRHQIQRYDFFRYLAVYKLGGFYFDMDVFLAKGVSPLCDYRCVFPFEELTVQTFLRRSFGMDWEVGNYAFGAAASHPFIGAIIENCVRAQQDPEWASEMMKPIPKLFREAFYVFDTSGPGLVSRTLAEFSDAAEEITVLFPDNVCDLRSWHCFGEFGVHLQHGAWRKKRGFFLGRLHRLWESRKREALLKESLKGGPKRSLSFRRPA